MFPPYLSNMVVYSLLVFKEYLRGSCISRFDRCAKLIQGLECGVEELNCLQSQGGMGTLQSFSHTRQQVHVEHCTYSQMSQLIHTGGGKHQVAFS